MLTLGPQLDSAQSLTKCLGVWDKLQDLICNTDTIDASKIGIVQTTKESIVCQVYRWRDTLNGEMDEDQIDAYSRVFHFDDGDVGILNRGAFFDCAIRGHLLEQVWEVHEEVIAGNKFWCHDEGVYVRS
jgi:hypothetical protein